MRQKPVKRRADHAERRIGIEHRGKRADPAPAIGDHEFRRGGRQRAARAGKRANEAVAREDAGALMIGGFARQHGMLGGNHEADIAGGRIDRADERDREDESERLEGGKNQTRHRHQERAAQKDVAQIEPRRETADAEREQCRTEQRRRRDNADRDRIEAERRQISRQYDDGETVAEAARGTRGEQNDDIAARGTRAIVSCTVGKGSLVHAQTPRHIECCTELGRRPSLGEFAFSPEISV